MTLKEARTIATDGKQHAPVTLDLAEYVLRSARKDKEENRVLADRCKAQVAAMRAEYLAVRF